MRTLHGRSSPLMGHNSAVRGQAVRRVVRPLLLRLAARILPFDRQIAAVRLRCVSLPITDRAKRRSGARRPPRRHNGVERYEPRRHSLRVGKLGRSRMTKPRISVDLWIDNLLGTRQPSLPQSDGSEVVPTSSERKAERTAQVARTIMEAEKEQRQANKARLQQARLEKKAKDRTVRTSSTPTKPSPGSP